MQGTNAVPPHPPVTLFCAGHTFLMTAVMQIQPRLRVWLFSRVEVAVVAMNVPRRIL